MVLFYLLPLWGVLGGWLVLGERVGRVRWLGVGLALMGAWLVLGGFDILQAVPSGFELFGLLAGLLYAMNNLVFRGVQGIPLSTKLSAMFLGCAGLALAALLVTDLAWPSAVTPLAWGGVLLYALCWLLPANLGAQYGVTHLEAGRASVILVLELVAAVVSATLIGGEQLAPLEWAGALLILVAALIEALRGTPDSTNQTQQPLLRILSPLRTKTDHSR
jgi:drug/metabolite transporter (DMT)-like permease